LVSSNVVVKIEGKSKKGLIFNAHVDTVPAGDTNLWKYGPYSGRIVDDKIYGLGASDEKSAIFILLNLAEQFVRFEPECDIWLTFVVNEEIDGSGTGDFTDWFCEKEKRRYQKVAAVLGEPTGLCKIEIAHKGNIFLKVTARGQSGHGSEPQKIKRHAVYEMMKVAGTLEKLNQRWSESYKNSLLGKPSVGVLTSISAGTNSSPNKFPESCVATFDIRTIPEMHDIALRDIRKILKDYNIKCVYSPVAFGFTDPESEIVKVFKNISKAEIGTSSGSNDMCFFTRAGIPALVFGPGEKKSIHKPNEYCLLSKIEKCTDIYKKAISEYAKNN
jgi:acetylornithine deacetylase/succinyl-diaminopimelate desuccinylase-like protein